MNYLIESSISMMLLYGLYFFVFRSFTFIRLNRVYLLLSLIFSLLIPTLTWQVPITSLGYTSITTGLYSFDNYKAFGNIPLNNPTHETSNSFDWFTIIQWVYVIGFVLMVARLFILIYRIFTINRTPSKPYIANTGKLANASFFNLIFIDDSQLEAHEVEQILTHERWHIRLLHSYDLLFVELVKMAFWFNPIVYFYQRSLAEVHEYEVDSRMIKQYHPQTYAHLLLKLAGLKVQPMMMHSFSRKPLSDRIHFLFTKQKSIPMKKLAYLSVLPILGLIMMAFSFETVVKKFQEKPNKNVESPQHSAVNNYPDVNVSDNKELFTVNTNDKKGQIFMTLSPRKVTPDLVNGIVAEHFKSYGYLIKVKNVAYNKDKKLTRIEISLDENEKNKNARDKKKVKVADLPSHFNFDLSKMVNKNPKELDAMIVLFADKNTGEHFVAPLGPPPPPPPMPPSPRPMPTKVKK